MLLLPSAWSQMDPSTPTEVVERKDQSSMESNFDRSKFRKPADSRVLVLDGGEWKVEKTGGGGVQVTQSTVLERSEKGEISTVQKGGTLQLDKGKKGEYEIASEYLRTAQSWTYAAMVPSGDWNFKSASAVERDKRGDCAGKSGWLAGKLNQKYIACRIAYGHPPGEKIGHAWVEAMLDGKPYVLDGTMSGGQPIPWDQHPHDKVYTQGKGFVGNPTGLPHR